MAITLRTETQAGATTKGSALTFSELDNNFIDLLTNKINPLQVDADSGSVTVGEAQSNGVLTITGGTGVTTSVVQDSAGDATITIDQSSDANTTYTIDAVQDGSDANVVLTGNDASTDTIQFAAGTGIQLTVDSAGQVTITNTVTDTDLDTTYSISAETATGGVNLRLTDSGAGTDDVKFAEGTGIQLTRTDANTITITNTVADTDTDTTYTVSAVDSGDNAIIRLTGSDASTDDITLAAGSNITITPVGDTITIAATDTDTGILNVVEDTTPQLGGALDGQGNKVENVELDDYKETIYTGGSTTGTITPDVANGNVQSITLTGSITLNAFANAEAGQSMTMIIKQPSSGGPYTLTSTMNWAGGTKTLSTAADAVDIVSILYDGTNYYASLSTNFS
jgi:hypothetical protein